MEPQSESLVRQKNLRSPFDRTFFALTSPSYKLCGELSPL